MDPSQNQMLTAQVVLLHPTISATVYWVLNKEKPGLHGTGTNKPPGWGNPGGGVGPDIDGFDEDGNSRSPEEMERAGAKREAEDETGFTDFQFIRHSASRIPFLVRHQDKHCIMTFVARLNSFTRLLPVKEEVTGEIVRGGWFNLSNSPVDIFHPEAILPYHSHIQRTIICLNMMARRAPQPKNYASIHPLWKLVFHVGNGDPRFPDYGYSLGEHWKTEMRHHLQSCRRTVDIDGIYERYQDAIVAKKKEIALLLPSEQQKVIPAHQAHYAPLLEEENHGELRDAYQRKLHEEEEAWRKFGEECARDRA